MSSFAYALVLVWLTQTGSDTVVQHFHTLRECRKEAALEVPFAHDGYGPQIVKCVKMQPDFGDGE